jgi:hypothetical protein
MEIYEFNSQSESALPFMSLLIFSSGWTHEWLFPQRWCWEERGRKIVKNQQRQVKGLAILLSSFSIYLLINFISRVAGSMVLMYLHLWQMISKTLPRRIIWIPFLRFLFLVQKRQSKRYMDWCHRLSKTLSSIKSSQVQRFEIITVG